MARFDAWRAEVKAVMPTPNPKWVPKFEAKAPAG